MMLFKILSGMDRSAFRSEVVSLRGHGPVSELIEGLGVPVHVLGMKPNRLTFAAVQRLRAITKALGPDLVHGWMYHGNFMATLNQAVAGGLRGRVLWNVRQTLYRLRDEKPGSAVVTVLNRVLSHSPAAIVYNSKIARAQHRAFGFADHHGIIIPNGFDCNLFKPSAEARAHFRSMLGLNEDHVLVGAIGHFHPRKDYPTLLKAAALVTQRHPQTRFLIAGRELTPDNPVLTQLIAAGNLQGRVFLLGERRDIPSLTAALDIACSSSARVEAFPNVIGEAMACGVPCAATAIGDTPMIVGESGRIAEPGSPDSLCEAISALVAAGPDGRRAMGELARRTILNGYSLESVVAQYEQLYRSTARA